MNEQEWSGKREDGDRIVGLVVALGLAVVVLAIAAIVAIKVLRPDAFKRNRGNAMAPTLITPESLEPFTANFTDVASEAGVTHVQASGATGQRLLPETMGSGVVLGDLDGDDDVDLLLLSYGSTPALYRNDSPRGGPIQFTDVTSESGLGDLRSTTTAAIGDVDDDGRLDLLVGRIGSDVLMRNLGDMRFEKMSEFGDGWTSSTGFVDIDNDSDVDLVVASYVKWSPEIDLEVNYTLDGVGRAYGPPTGFEGTDLALYINDGKGSFSDESEKRGLLIRRDDRDVPVMKALGLCFEYFSNTGGNRIDIIVANDTTPNRLFINDGNGGFEEHGTQLGVAYDIDGKSTGAMGVDMSWRDSTLHCAIGNFANEPSSLYEYHRYGQFRSFIDQSSVSGVGPATRNSLTFGTLFADFDFDGHADLLQINGHIEPEIARVQDGQTYKQRAQLFRGTGGEPAFIEVPAEELGDLSEPIVGRAAAMADLDRDGDHDLVVSRVDGVPLILRNNLGLTGMRTISVRVKTKSGAPLVGAAEVLVVIGGSGRRISSASSATRSYMSQSDTAIRVGLAPQEFIDRVDVRFSSGARLSVNSPTSDEIVITEP